MDAGGNQDCGTLRCGPALERSSRARPRVGVKGQSAAAPTAPPGPIHATPSPPPNRILRSQSGILILPTSLRQHLPNKGNFSARSLFRRPCDGVWILVLIGAREACFWD